MSGRRRLAMIVGAVVMMGLAYVLRDMPGSAREPSAEGVDSGVDAQGAAAHGADSGRRARDSTRSGESNGAAPLSSRVALLNAPSASESTSATGHFRGRVVDQRSQAGVAQAALSIRSGDQVSLVETDREGVFDYEPERVGVHELVLVEAEGYFPFAPTWGHSPIRLVATAHQSVDGIVLRLEPKHALRVTVRDEEDRPVEGELVLLGLPVESLAPLESSVVLTDGAADVVAPEGTIIEAFAEGRAGRGRVDDVAIATGNLAITVSGGRPGEATLRGRVSDDATGAPIAEALVEVRDESDRDFAFARVLTDETGSFHATLRGAGPFSLWIRAAGYAGEGRDDVEPDEAIELSLVADAAVVGSVVDEAGAPVRAFAVLAEAHLGRVERSLRGSSAVIDGGGRFRLGGLASGRYDLKVYADGYLCETRQVDVARELERELAPITLRAAAVLRGVVQAADGQPIADAQVQIERAFDPEPVWAGEHLTDSSGHFEIRALSEGPTTLLVSAAHFHSRLVVANSEGLTQVQLNPTEGEATQLELTGIGAELRGEEDVVRVVRAFPDGGAALAGLVGGERILSVDGTPVSELGFVGSVERIRGPENSVVRLSVRTDAGERDVLVRRVPIRAH